MNKTLVKDALVVANRSLSKKFDEDLGGWIVTILGPSESMRFTASPNHVGEVCRLLLAAEAVRSLRPDRTLNEALDAAMEAEKERSFQVELSHWLGITSPLVQRAVEILAHNDHGPVLTA